MKYYRLASFAPWVPEMGDHWTIDVPIELPELFQWDGKRVRRWNPKLIAVYSEAPYPIDFALATYREYAVFSRRLRRFFEDRFPDLIQFLPFRLQRDDGSQPMRGYSFGNFLKVIDCIDKQHTMVEDDDWTPTDDGIYMTRGPLYLHRPAIEDAVCFLVQGTCGYVIVRGDVHEELERRRFIGCRFEEVRVWPDS